MGVGVVLSVVRKLSHWDFQQRSLKSSVRGISSSLFHRLELRIDRKTSERHLGRMGGDFAGLATPPQVSYKQLYQLKFAFKFALISTIIHVSLECSVSHSSLQSWSEAPPSPDTPPPPTPLCNFQII